jgi:hypothetical protein
MTAGIAAVSCEFMATKFGNLLQSNSPNVVALNLQKFAAEAAINDYG